MGKKNGGYYVHTPHDPPSGEDRADMGVFEPTLTRQSEKDACDVNLIVKRFEVTGILPEAGSPGAFLDVSAMPDYRGALEYLREAERAFMTLPPEVRREFDNDAARLLDAVADPSQHDRLAELGLWKKPVVESTAAKAAEAAAPAAKVDPGKGS